MSVNSLRNWIRLGLCLAFFGFAGTAIAGTFEASDSADVRVIKAKVRAAQFLSKATFGPTQADIDSLSTRIGQIGYRKACEEWIDNEFTKTATFQKQRIDDLAGQFGVPTAGDDFSIRNLRYYAWWDIALQADDQLRQKFAWAMSQIFVISDEPNAFSTPQADESGLGTWIGPSIYYDTVLVDNAFGSYRDLLTDMTFSPVMGTYLSHLRNRKASIPDNRFPDENYAREVMQLFSIGLYDLEVDGRLERDLQGELIPSYDNEEIKTLGRLFTGFKYNNDSLSIYGPRNMNEPMEIWAPEHDNNLNYAEDPDNPGQSDPNAPAEKSLFGTTLGSIPASPSEQQVIDEIEEGLDILYNHKNTAPFLCRRLIQRMVTSNPSRGYVRRVARKFINNGSGVRGDFRAVCKAILLDPEVFRGQRLLRRRSPLRLEVKTRGTEYTRLREPVLRITSMIRALEPTSDFPGGRLILSRNVEGVFGQSAYRAPSVFNFYLPNFQPPGDLIGFQPSRRNPNGALFAPEFQILTAVTANNSVNTLRSWVVNRNIRTGLRIVDGNPNSTNPDVTNITLDLDDQELLVMDINNMPQLLEEYDLLFCNGSLSDATKDIIIKAVQDHLPTDNAANAQYRAEQALLAVLLSADCAIEE